MGRTRTIGIATMILGISLCAVAQNEQAPPRTGPAPAFGQNAPILDPDNPPISGLDEAGLDLRGAPSSFISGGLAVAESADSNAENSLKQQNLQSVTHLLGAFDLQRFYTKTDVFAEYFGGGAFYSDSTRTATQLHALGVEIVERWRTGRLTLRDSFSYLPEGSFSVGSFGGVPGIHLALGGYNTGFAGAGLHLLGAGQYGSVGLTPRLANTAIADVVQSLNPRSALTFVTAFSNAHFFDDTGQFINSDQFTTMGGYSYMIGRRDQVAGVYAFQQFRFPDAAGGEIRSYIGNFRWGHTISGRMSLLVGAGPQYTQINDITGYTTRWSGNGMARLHYRFTHSTLSVGYEKFTSAGSGFYAGADVQLVRATLNRPLGRTWEFTGDVGYSHNSRLQTQAQQGTPGSYFNSGFVGGILRHYIGRNYSVFAAYRYNQLGFDKSFCAEGDTNCSRISHRHIGTIGVEWHPRPIRLE